MDVEQVKQQIIEKIHLSSINKGYITTDEIIDLADEFELPLDEIDRICEHLLIRGYIFKDFTNVIDDDLEYDADNNRIDYEKIYQQAISIDSSLSYYIKSIKCIKPPYINEAKSILYQAKEGNLYARTRIISMYLKVVVRIALWFHDKYNIPLAEAIQDGNTGLIIALEKMPLDSTYKFASYSTWWIRQLIEREANSANYSFYFPAHIKSKLFKVQELLHKYTLNTIEGSSEFLIEKISNNLSVDYNTAEKYFSYVQLHDSIEELLESNENEDLFSDNCLLLDKHIEYLDSKKLNSILNEIFTSLSDSEYRIIASRYGFIDGSEKTLEELGSEFELTRERIRQIEMKIIRKINTSEKKQLLKSFYTVC